MTDQRPRPRSHGVPFASDPRGRWIGITSPDGLTVQGCEWDGFHVQLEGVIKASYYAGEAGTCPFAALERYRAIQEQENASNG